MESNSNIDWKKKYEAQERIILDHMTDLANYRILVAQLKAEVNHYKTKFEQCNDEVKKREDYLRRILFEDIVYDYHESFEN